MRCLKGIQHVIPNGLVRFLFVLSDERRELIEIANDNHLFSLVVALSLPHIKDGVGDIGKQVGANSRYLIDDEHIDLAQYFKTLLIEASCAATSYNALARLEQSVNGRAFHVESGNAHEGTGGHVVTSSGTPFLDVLDEEGLTASSLAGDEEIRTSHEVLEGGVL